MLETNSYNPDVLSCIANLSSDEVFTPPQIVNQMLDLLPQEIFCNKKIRFLDPACKSGVFLREIAKRLIKGLEKEIPDLQERLNHIYGKQLFGLAITELTALLSRRSLYCSRLANGRYSVATVFDSKDGNINFERVEHSWDKKRCIQCGASKSAYDRSKELESHAYSFIHNDNPEEIFKMKFDVIIGNPPYQIGADGSTRDMPIYNLFVDSAKKMSPTYICMIIPSRWMATGLGLSDFRKSMLNDRHIKTIVDFPDASEVFPSVEIKGGVCYFLWDKSHDGDCDSYLIRNSNPIGPIKRNLSEHDIFVRDGQSASILRKVLKHNESSIINILSADKEFGWTSNFSDFSEKYIMGSVPLYYIRKTKRNKGWIERDKVKKSPQLIDSWKVLIPAAGSDGGKKLPDYVLGKPLTAPNPSVCTQSFLFFSLNTEKEAQNLETYLKTKFFRFLVSLRKITQHATRSTYTWVPIQDWNKPWTDDDLYSKYELTADEIDHIEAHITYME